MAGEVSEPVGLWPMDWVKNTLAPLAAASCSKASTSGPSAWRGTPTIFINGKRHAGPRSLEGFKPVVEAEIKAADDLIKAGTPLDKVYETRARANAG